jgi:hypothetical protein
MEIDKPETSPPVAADHKRAIAALGLAATLAACAFAVTSAVRIINSPDIGYHLAYGEEFLDTGKIVQTNQWTWYPLDSQRLSDPAALGPGCSYDADTHTYHFVNGNWGTQAVVAAVYRAGGMKALALLQVAVWVGILTLVIVTLRRNGVPWHWVGLPVILIFLACDERIPIRPEIFGFLFLAGQWTLLAGPGFGPKRAVGVVLLQLLAVNFHSYFLLGIGLAGAMAFEAWWRQRESRRRAQPDPAAAQRWKWLAAATVGTLAASLCNPWFARGAIMPIETMLFLRRYHIGEPGSTHPWGAIAEFARPLSAKFSGDRTVITLVVVALPAMFAMILAMLRQRWGWALAILAMLATAFQMHRNIAPALIIVTPLTTIILLMWAAEKLAQRNQAAAKAQRGKQPSDSATPAPSPRGPIAVAVGTLLVGVGLTLAVVTNVYFTSNRRPPSFGLRASQLLLPQGAAEWINRHEPPGRVFANFDITSNLMFLTRPHRDMPVLTNTWATPPYVQVACLLYTVVDALKQPELRRDFNFKSFAAANDIQTVVIGFHGQVTPLMVRLAHDSDWAIVYIGPGDIVFVQKNGSAAKLAEGAITAENFPVLDYIHRVEASDASPAMALANAARLLKVIGWDEQASTVMRRAAELDPNIR